MSYGLAPRPGLAPEEMAALVAAAEEVLQARTQRVADQMPSWRFSGRWFNAGSYAFRRPNRPS